MLCRYVLEKCMQDIAWGKSVYYRKEEWGAIKEINTYSWFGTRLSWQIDGLDDPPGLFTSLCLIAFVSGLCLEVLKYYLLENVLDCAIETRWQHFYNIETCRMSLTDNLTPYLLIGPRHNFVALSLSYSSFYFCFN